MTLPNQLTILRIILTPIALFLLLMQGTPAKQMATGIFLVAAFTDWYDGHFARKYGYVTKWGKFLDPLADKILISTMLFGFVVLKYIKFGWVIVIVLRDLIITVMRGYMVANGKPISANLLAKWKTFSQVGLVYALLIYINIEIYLGSDTIINQGSFLPKFKVYIDYYLPFVALFTVVTGLIYVIENRRPLRELFWRLYRIVIPFRLIVDSKPENTPYSKSGILHKEVDIKTTEAAHSSKNDTRSAGNSPQQQP